MGTLGLGSSWPIEILLSTILFYFVKVQIILAFLSCLHRWRFSTHRSLLIAFLPRPFNLCPSNPGIQESSQTLTHSPQLICHTAPCSITSLPSSNLAQVSDAFPPFLALIKSPWGKNQDSCIIFHAIQATTALLNCLISLKHSSSSSPLGAVITFHFFQCTPLSSSPFLHPNLTRREITSSHHLLGNSSTLIE